MKQLAPSILSADFICLGEQLKQLQKLCIHYLHIDVMDGMFVPSISFGMPVIASLRKHTDMFFDVHLMIEEPIRYVNALRQAGADGLTVHAEACADLPGTIAAIRESGAKPAVCLSPKTPLSKLDGILDQVDMVLIMGVEPGFGGQTLIWETLEKVKQLHKIRKEQGLFFKIEIDGGVTKENARAVAACGVDIVVAGTAVFRGDIEENIHVLQEEIEKKQLNIEVEAFHTEDCSKVIGNYDLVLLMPQIRYNFKNISKLLKPIETKVITNEQINHINDLLDVIIESKEQCKK